MPISEREIQRELGLYLAGRMSVANFYRWVSQRAVDSAQWANAATGRMAMRLMNALSVHAAGGWSEDELQNDLRPLLRVQTAVVDIPTAPSYRLHLAGSPSATSVERELRVS